MSSTHSSCLQSGPEYHEWTLGRLRTMKIESADVLISPPYVQRREWRCFPRVAACELDQKQMDARMSENDTDIQAAGMLISASCV